MATNCNVYYKDYYCPTVGLTNYTEQFKEYIDAKFEEMPSDEELKQVEANLAATMGNVETNLANSLNNVQCNLAASISNSESNIAKQVDNASNKTICCLKETICQANTDTAQNITEAKEEITATTLQLLTNVETNLSNAITTSADNVVKAVSSDITTSADNVVKQVYENAQRDKEEIIAKIEETTESGNNDILEAITAAKDELKEHAETVKEEITGTTLTLVGNIESNLSNAITESADNVVKAVSSDITTSADNVVNQVYENTEREKGEIITAVISKTEDIINEVDAKAKENKEIIDKAREELIAALNNTNSLMEAGFTDLNTAVIANKEDAVHRINRQAYKNKTEIINAISDITPEPYTVYGGSVYNIVHPDVMSMTEADVKNLTKIENVEGTDTVFSIRIKDVSVAGMNDDATGEVYNQAKATNELNIVFAYPAKFTDVEVRDSIDMNVTDDFAVNTITIDGESYNVLFNPTKITNLYDPQWESPMDYTLTYTLDVQ